MNIWAALIYLVNCRKASKQIKTRSWERMSYCVEYRKIGRGNGDVYDPISLIACMTFSQYMCAILKNKLEYKKLNPAGFNDANL